MTDNVIEKNGRQYSKSLLKGQGVSYIVKKLIKDGKLEGNYSDVIDKLNNELKSEDKIA